MYSNTSDISSQDGWTTNKWTHSSVKSLNYNITFFTGLSVKLFENNPAILELQCSGDVLQPASNIVTMVMYTAEDKEPIISINVGKDQCLSYKMFASCAALGENSRKTRISALILDLLEGETRHYGCTVGFESRGWTDSVSWRLQVYRNSKSRLTSHPILPPISHRKRFISPALAAGTAHCHSSFINRNCLPMDHRLVY